MAVKSAERTLAILDLFARERRALTARTVQTALGYPASSTIGLLKTLMRSGHLRFDRRTRLYVPTLRVVLLGDWIRATPLGSDRLRRALDRLPRDADPAATVAAVHALVDSHRGAVAPEDDRTVVAVGVRALHRSSR